jgi:hypothetical protein
MHNEVNKNTILGVTEFVLLMAVIYEVHRRDDPRWHDIHTNSHDDQFRHSRNIMGKTSTISWGYNIDIAGGFCITRH